VILQNGLSLVCPQPTGQGAIELLCADQGRQLFSSADVNMVAALVDLFTQAHESRSERNRLIQQERERIKQDMHDTLGGRLLSIMRVQGEPRSAQLATSAWRELRDILTALEGAPVMLSQALDQWHRDTRRQLEGEGVDLRWQVDDALREKALQLNGFQRLNLGQILREGLNNALRHSSPGLIEVYYGWRGDQLYFELCNDGVSQAPQQWTTGRGLHHIRQRAAKLGASADWSMRDAGRVVLTITMPLRSDDT
jgi:signal transduction histidine kinase